MRGSLFPLCILRKDGLTDVIALASQHSVGISVEQAHALTERIRQTANDLWSLLIEAHESGAWSVLGYASWGEYVDAELTISVRHSYRLLDQGRVIRGIQEAASTRSGMCPVGHKPAVVDITERLARRISPELPKVEEEIRERVAAGEPAAAAVSEVISAYREAPTPPVEAPPASQDDEEGYDLAQEFEFASAEIDRLNALVDSLSKTDQGREIVSLNARYAALNGRLQQEITTCNEAKRQSKYQSGLLQKVRVALSVEANSEIISAIEALKS